MPRNGTRRSAQVREQVRLLAEKNEPIFVFGSNRAGRHGKGAARWARLYRGATRGVGEGMQGHSYGIPTKDERLGVLPLSEIQEGVGRFLRFARENPQLRFEVTPIGTGYAGYLPGDIAPFFVDEPVNVFLPAAFKQALGRPS